ncbi:MAG: hypothetical protein PHH41_00535 [Sulfurimonas sp.]|nr:hypothetical protein [Sulfurimonas sp.]MDD3059351.1 hypothetical protein [Sulfurimonas sp.]MDD5201606.1 hypothetical protein [Sulfurimonas sp.]
MFQIHNTQNGVKAILGGFNAEDLQKKIQACQEGKCECECDPAMMQKITNIEVRSEAQGASITIEGDVEAAELAPMMQGCLL